MFPEIKWRRARSDWRHSLPLALAALTAAEPQIPELGTKPAAVRTFRKAGRWLISEDASISDPVLRQIFRSNGSHAWIQWLCRRLGRRIAIRSHAQAIFLKSNLRAFYPALPITVKVANPGRPRASRRIANEIESRRRLVDAGIIGLPRLYAASAKDAFLAEELIDARPVRRSGLTPREIARQLLCFHQANGIEFMPAGLALDIDRDCRLVADYSSRLGMAIPGGIASLAATPGLSSALAACALCHGDLTVTNLMIVREKLFITDWEWAERTLVFSDAVRLATQLDGFDACFLDEFNGLSKPAAPILDPTTQFLLAALHVAARRIARRSDFEDPRALRAYDARLKDRFLRITRLIERLSAAAPPAVDSLPGKK
ncbi:MAG: hypothetical protein AB7S92_03290 [Parvibaculaceae bacterium]